MKWPGALCPWGLFRVALVGPGEPGDLSADHWNLNKTWIQIAYSSFIHFELAAFPRAEETSESFMDTSAP